MTRIRKIEIRHFRGIRELDWLPSPGINCLIGPGDTRKSTVLDAIDLCLGARRNIAIADSDFYKLDVEQPINISLTLGNLDDELLSLDAYGIFHRGMVLGSTISFG
jgi:putative ATP-dependent endonuclease of the OLD family